MSTPLRIGELELDTPLISAPVAGFTDLAFREIVREFGGCGLIFTEMVSAGGWVRGDREQPRRLFGVAEEPKPLGVQLWDRDPTMVEEAARRLGDYRVSVIDLNFGCPKRRIMGKQGAGATLLRDPATIHALVAATVRGAGTIPVTAKIRLGVSIDNPTAPAVAIAAEAAGASAVTVHGRTAEDGYGSPVDHERIAEVVQCVSIPVIANGDIACAETALTTLERTGAAGLMIARAALSRPWVFREITAALRGEPIPPPPTLTQQKEQILRHLDAMIAIGGAAWGTARMRKFAGQYLAGVPGAREFRARISKAKSPEAFLEVADEWFPTDEVTASPRRRIESCGESRSESAP